MPSPGMSSTSSSPRLDAFRMCGSPPSGWRSNRTSTTCAKARARQIVNRLADTLPQANIMAVEPEYRRAACRTRGNARNVLPSHRGQRGHSGRRYRAAARRPQQSSHGSTGPCSSRRSSTIRVGCGAESAPPAKSGGRKVDSTSPLQNECASFRLVKTAFTAAHRRAETRRKIDR